MRVSDCNARRAASVGDAVSPRKLVEAPDSICNHRMNHLAWEAFEQQAVPSQSDVARSLAVRIEHLTPHVAVGRVGYIRVRCRRVCRSLQSAR